MCNVSSGGEVLGGHWWDALRLVPRRENGGRGRIAGRSAECLGLAHDSRWVDRGTPGVHGPGGRSPTPTCGQRAKSDPLPSPGQRCSVLEHVGSNLQTIQPSSTFPSLIVSSRQYDRRIAHLQSMLMVVPLISP